MSVQPSTYEREFTIGPVRVTLWKKTVWCADNPTNNGRQVTLDCVYTDITGQMKRTEVVKIQDIPKAILALKQAYDYAVKSGKSEERATPTIDSGIVSPDRVA